MTPTNPERMDAIIIGTGQGGKPLAGALAEAGWNCAVIERDRIGGTCVIRGCTPTKTMVASARIAHLARRASDYGIGTGEVTVDLSTVRKRKRDIVDAWSAGSRKGLERHPTLDLILGTARFTAPGTVEVDLNDGGVRTLTSDHIFINVGARNRIPDIAGLEAVDFLDSTSIMELDSVPGHLIVLGGGFIGLEFGQMFRRFGAEVTVVDHSGIAGREDSDISEAIEKILRGEGIEIVYPAVPHTVASINGGVEVTVESGGQERVLRGSHLLVAVGIVPNSDTLNLSSAGIAVGERGEILVDDRCQTNVPGVWALGDVTGAPPFTHTAYDDYRIIANNVLEGGDASRNGRILSYAVFIDPQLGRVGLSERDAEAAGLNYRVAKLPMSRVARAIEMDETRGFMKAVVDADTDEILGAAILGIEGGEVVTVLQVAMMGGLPWTALRDAMIAHPTLSESLNNLFMTLK
ncbi:MAG: mercuric reductase [Gemmatimonadetes bacterium]|nr:mercuric reductase [Gemmatimonadota bacterium]